MAKDNRRMDNLEDFDSLKETLMNVSNEIDAIKNSFSKSAEDLTKIQSMLSVGNLEELNEKIEKERDAFLKLWDGYKKQKEELSNVNKTISEYQELARQAEASKKQLENDYNMKINELNQKLEEYQDKALSFDKYKTKCEEFDTISNKLECEIHDLKEENTNKENIINEMNSKIEDFSSKEDSSEFKEKYEKERERFTKLNQIYEETDSECKRLRQENKDWQNWYDSNKENYNKIFSSPPEGKTTTNLSPPEIHPEEPDNSETQTENTSEKESKKKKLFRHRK